ncbi:MAG: SH3 domain-containing protein [Anaerolineae bacterium]|nr:SH3 domain-containing protein [Anaerolineae bacterium]
MKRLIWGLGGSLLLILVLGLGFTFSQPTAAQNVGTGWTGTFYNNTNLSGTPVVSNIPYPNGVFFNWSSNPPKDGNGVIIPGMPADNFSAFFTSTQQFNVAGNYSFIVYANDGVRVFIDNQIFLDQFAPFNNPAPNAFQTFTFTYVKNVPGPVNIRVEYVEFANDSNLVVQWNVPGGGGGGGGGGLTPTGPTATPVPIATAEVITVKGLALRTGPYLGASMVGVIRPNKIYPILEKNFDEGLFPWYRLQDGDRVGWASGRYLRVNGNVAIIPTTQTVFDRIDNPTDLPSALNVIGYTRSVMNLRRRPSERTQLLDQIPWGDGVQIIGRTVQGNRNFWLQVRWRDKVGWIYAPFVTIEGLIEAVPIR